MSSTSLALTGDMTTQFRDSIKLMLRFSTICVVGLDFECYLWWVSLVEGSYIIWPSFAFFLCSLGIIVVITSVWLFVSSGGLLDFLQKSFYWIKGSRQDLRKCKGISHSMHCLLHQHTKYEGVKAVGELLKAWILLRHQNWSDLKTLLDM